MIGLNTCKFNTHIFYMYFSSIMYTISEEGGSGGSSCHEIYSLIGTAGVSFLLILSELLPYIKSIKGNSILQAIQKSIKKEEPQQQYSEVPSESEPLVNV